MKKLAVVTLSTLVALGLSGCNIFYPNSDEPRPSFSSSQPTDSATDLPSEEPSIEPTPSPSVTSTVVKGSAKISIIDASYASNLVTVIAEVTNFAEDGGNCTLSLSIDGQTKSVTVKAEANVTTTQCFAMEIATDDLPAGAATFTVAYDSPEHAGKSKSQALEITE